MFSFFRKKMSSEELAMLVKNKEVVLLDVRQGVEYKSGHIPGSVNIPLSTLENRIKSLVKQKDQRIVVHCLSGSRSAQAASTLRAMGYTQVENFGGISRYKGTLKQ
ncbi:MAG: rhodanese-like domain-containing protein [Erysipelotrichaceae bacterium]